MINKKEQKNIISVANLPAEYTIDDPKEFSSNFRREFLKKVRKTMGLSVKEVAEKTGIEIKELIRIENGDISDQDMMNLHNLSIVYGLKYKNILFVCGVADKSSNLEYGMAAYHDKDLDIETQQEFSKLIEKIRK